MSSGMHAIHRFLEFELDVAAAELRRSGQPVRIFPRAFDLLTHLIEHRERVVTREELLAVLWPDVTVTAAVLTQTVWELRKVLGNGTEPAALIRNARGRGYRFTGAVETSIESAAQPAGTADGAGRVTTQASAVPLPMSLTYVGREPELQRLRSAFEHATRGRGALFLVGGEPGIGKTRFAEEILSWAKLHGAASFEGRCCETEGAPPFWPWLQIVRGMVAQLTSAELREYMGPSAPDLCRFCPELRASFPIVSEPAARGADRDRFHLLDSVATLLVRASQAQPLCLLLDDVHWADRASLLLLETLAPLTARAQIVVVATYRSTELDPSQAFAQSFGNLAKTCEQISLAGLSAAESSQLLSAEAPDVDRPLASEVHRITTGNPLFVLQIARLVCSDATTAAALAAGQLVLPDQVREMISQRLARLPCACMEALRWAAALGPRFRLADLRRVTDRSEDAMLELLQTAVDARIVGEEQLGVYRFSHPLIREALHQSLRMPERARVHQRIGLMIEATSRDDDLRRLDELAYHFYEAAAIGSAERAVEYAERAGARAMTSTAYEAAADYFEKALQALELMPTIDPSRAAELRLRRGEALRGAREVPEKVRALFVEVAEQAKLRDDANLMARAALGYSGLGPLRMSPAREAGTVDPVEIALLEQALDAMPSSDTALRALCLGQLAYALYYTRERKRREQLANAALEMARRSSDKKTLAEVLLMKHRVLTAPDQLEERLALTSEIIALTEVMGFKALEIDAYVQRATLLLQKGQLPACDADMASVVRLSQQTPQPHEPEWWRHYEMLRMYWQGRFADAERESKRLGEKRTHVGVDQGHAIRALIAGWQQGRAADFVDELVAFACKYPLPVVWRCSLAWIYVHVQRFEDARRELERLAVHDFEDLPFDHNWLSCHMYLAEVCRQLGDRNRAALVHRALSPYCDRVILVGHHSMFVGPVWHPLGRAAMALERWDEAEHCFGRALAIHRAFDAKSWQPIVQLDYAEVLWRRNRGRDRQRARSLHEASLATAKELGLGIVLQRAHTLFERSNAQSADALASMDQP
jgi:DNA-binding winged helix-turn-helix (wHTH) protein/tetratricopeptide (TPR) repeat protein